MAKGIIRIDNNKNTLTNLIKELNKINVNIHKYNEVVFDLSKYTRARPHVLSVLTVFKEKIFKNHPHLIVSLIEPEYENTSTYVNRMGFYETNSFDYTEYPYNKHSSEGRFIELKFFNKNNQDNINSELEKIFLNMKIPEDMVRALSFSLAEIIDNTCCHSESKFKNFICAQKFSDCVRVSIVDGGIGIASSLGQSAEYGKRGFSNVDLIEMSIEKSVSSKLNDDERAHQGFGLYAINQIAKMNGGSLEIHSNDANLITKNNETKVIDAGNWNGTIIYLTLNIEYDVYRWRKIWEELFDDDPPFISEFDDFLF